MQTPELKGMILKKKLKNRKALTEKTSNKNNDGTYLGITYR